jgi:glycosyltransferase involved in cell wall biosynthesis
VFNRNRIAFNADRFLNRYRFFPRHLRLCRSEFDLYHVCDHSYAHLVHELPADRTGVYCHDLDAFRCLIDTRRQPRPRWFRALSRRVLAGMQRAARVFVSTEVMRRQVEALGLLETGRLVLAPYGVSPEFRPPASDGSEIPALPPEVRQSHFLLHVGSCIPRKRLDVLLDVFAAVRNWYPSLRLVKVGGRWSADQVARIRRLGIAGAVTQYTDLDRGAIAALYARSSLTLLPSEAEGFGLPVIEALACGAAVVASDIPVLREVGGDAVTYCPVGDVPQWVHTVGRLLSGATPVPPLAARFARSACYSWESHAATIRHTYEQLLSEARSAPRTPEP